MKVTQEKLPASQVGLEIEITPEMSQKAYEKALQNFTRSANIPGFRKGKVPRQVLIQRFGASRIKATVVEELIEDSLKQALEQEKIEAIGNFELRSSFEDLVANFEPGNPLTFSAAVDVPPEVKLTDYKGLRVQAEEVKPDAERVQQVLENYRNQSATLVPVDGRSAQAGDVAVVDFVGRYGSGEQAGEPFPGGSAEDFQLDIAEGKFIPGFVEGIVGMNPGDSKEVAVTFPEDYPQAELSGQPATFTITLKELKARELPELDDDLAQEVSEFETLVELRESLETRFREEAEQRTKANKEQALLDELVNHVEVEIPETLVRREVDYMVTQTAMQLSQQGIDIRQILTRELVEQMRERSRPEALTRIKRTLALGEVAKQESLKLEASETETKMQELMAEYEGQDIDPDRLRQVVEEDLLREKILAWLEANGTVELVPEGTLAPSPEEAAAADVETSETAAGLEAELEAAAPPAESADATIETALAAEDPAEAPKKSTKRSKDKES